MKINDHGSYVLETLGHRLHLYYCIIGRNRFPYNHFHFFTLRRSRSKTRFASEQPMAGTSILYIATPHTMQITTGDPTVLAVLVVALCNFDVIHESD